MRMPLRFGLGFTLILVSGCLEPFQAPTAYSELSFACEDPQGLAPRLASCQQSHAGRPTPCGGVVSYRGRLESKDIIVDTTFERSSIQVVPGRTPGSLVINEARGTAISPYFRFSLIIGSLGGASNQVDTTTRTLAFNDFVRGNIEELEDAQAVVTLRLTTGGESVALNGRTAAGELKVTYKSDARLTGSFEGAFGSGEDQLSGCFDIVAQETRTLETGL